MPIYDHPDVAAIIALAMREDLRSDGDLTVRHCVPHQARLVGRVVAKEAGVVVGMPLWSKVCAAFNGGAVDVEFAAEDGQGVEAGDEVLRFHGDAGSILIAERTFLNLAQRLSGAATITRRYATLVAGTHAKVFDTRKTDPGLRLLQKHAVVCGGGANHRIGLYDQILIKENHIALMGAAGPAEAVRRCRSSAGDQAVIEVEIEGLEDLDPVIEAGADIVLLDNMGPDLLAAAVRIRGQRSVQLEASGGIDLETVRPVAESGVDRISVGALTHSVQALDLSLRCQAVD